MQVFERKSRIEVPVKELFNWHNRSRVFDRLTPPWEKTKVIENKKDDIEGNRLVREVQQGSFRRRWMAVHNSYVEGDQFADEQVLGPFAKWTHLHQLLPETDTTCQLIDHIEYQPPVWLWGRLIAKQLDRLFSFRHTRTQNDLKRYHPYAQQPPLKIVISGASGMIGTALATFLACAGNHVQTLVRRPPKLESTEIFWDPYMEELDKASIESVDAVIHLAGFNISAGRWTPQRKEMIRKSRAQGTRFLSETLAALKHPPKVLVVSSAIGYYGNRGDEVLIEESPAGEGFLPETCQAWEDAAEPARKAGIRTVNIRTGIVLTTLGGALAKMLPPFSMGVGGKLGSGTQWMSWISFEDLIGIFHYLIHTEGISGPVNATAPWPVTNAAFTKILGKVLGRPTPLPMPQFLVKTLFGEIGEALLLEGQQVKPVKLTQAGFEFFYPDLESALRWELGSNFSSLSAV